MTKTIDRLNNNELFFETIAVKQSHIFLLTLSAPDNFFFLKVVTLHSLCQTDKTDCFYQTNEPNDALRMLSEIIQARGEQKDTHNMHVSTNDRESWDFDPQEQRCDLESTSGKATSLTNYVIETSSILF